MTEKKTQVDREQLREFIDKCVADNKIVFDHLAKI